MRTCLLLAIIGTFIITTEACSVTEELNSLPANTTSSTVIPTAVSTTVSTKGLPIT